MMIIRQSLLRQSRNGVSRNIIRASRRCIATETASGTTSYNDASSDIFSSEGATRSADSGVTPSQSPRAGKKTAQQSAEEYLEFKRQKALLGSIGADRNPAYEPHQLLNDPPRPAEVTLELLLASQAHMGHNTARWNPANAQYIFGVRDDTHIISLDATAAHLRRAAKVVSAVAAKAGNILFVGTRKGQERAVVKAAQLAGGFHLFDRWVPGSLTNSQQILGRCRLKVVNEKDEEQLDFDDQLMDTPPMKPDLVVVLNPLECNAMLRECAMNGIPTIGIVDTDCDPLKVTYPIPANDDSLRCIAVIAGVLGRAGEEGRRIRLARAERGRITLAENVKLRPRRG